MDAEDDHRDPWELSPFYVALAAVFALAYLEVAFAAPPVSTARPVAAHNQAAAAFLYGRKDLAPSPAPAPQQYTAASPPIPRPRPTATRTPS
jgi:hypothetical protein